MKKIITIIISLTIGILLIIWLYQKVDLIRVFNALKILRVWQIIILFSLSISVVFIRILRWKIILEALEKKRFSYSDLVGPRLGENSISYLTPAALYGGEVFRILLLKSKKNVPITTATTSIILDKLTEIMGLCMFSFLSAAALVISGNFIWAFFLIVIGLFILLLLIVIFKLVGLKTILFFLSKFIPNKNKEKRLNTLSEKIKFIGEKASSTFRKTPYIFYQGTILSFLILFINSIEISLFIFFLHGGFNLINAFPMKILSMLSGLIPISAGLGAFEGVNILAFKSFNYSAGLALAYSFYRRLVDFSIVFVGVSFIMRYITKGLSKTEHFFSTITHQNK